MGLTAPHPLRLGMAPGQWVERHGEGGQRRGMSEGAEHVSGAVGALPVGV